jgi:chaperone BCS1
MEILENLFQGKPLNTEMLVTMIISLYGITIVMFIFKSIPEKIIETFLYHFTTKMFISSMDECYYSLITLFEKTKLVNKTRSIRLLNGTFGSTNHIAKSIGDGNHYFVYKGVLIKVKYKIEDTMFSSDKVHITLIKFGRSHILFDELRNELQALLNVENNTDELTVYSYNLENLRWRSETSIRKRDFTTIFIDDDIKSRLINHLDKFYANEDWYHERGIPYQTGICLYGPPGTGKTSIVKGLASYYNKSLCILRSSELDKLPHALKHLPNESFIIVEDIDTSSIIVERNPEETLEDALYNKVIKSKSNHVADGVEAHPPIQETASEYVENPVSKPNKNKDSKNTSIMGSYTKVLLSDILNAMDGLISIEKRVIIFTTNHIEKLDKALIRPGRIDCLEEINYISYAQFVRFCTIFYKDRITEEEKENITEKYSRLKNIVTIATLQKDFLQGMSLQEMLDTYCE